MNDLHRGEIYYISRGGASYGHEQQADRPAVIVSNEKNNENSGVVEVVYLTTQPKTDLPTHTVIRSTGRVSTVLCEQIVSVSVDRIAGYIGQVSEQEQKNIDIALMISLALDGDTKTSKQYNETIKQQNDEIERLKAEIADLQQEYEDAIAEIEQEAAVHVEENKKVEQSASQESMIRLETERDTFKQLYESLLAKVMAS
jgi:mRNA interferase MazF